MKQYYHVERTPDGKYKIGIGVGRTFKANDLTEVSRGLTHYFNDVVNVTEKSPFDRAAHLKHNDECDCCPLCRKETSTNRRFKGAIRKRAR